MYKPVNKLPSGGVGRREKTGEGLPTVFVFVFGFVFVFFLPTVLPYTQQGSLFTR